LPAAPAHRPPHHADHCAHCDDPAGHAWMRKRKRAMVLLRHVRCADRLR
jgi:hypothetical protein